MSAKEANVWVVYFQKDFSVYHAGGDEFSIEYKM